MIKIFDMVNGVFETPGKPDHPVTIPVRSRDREPATRYQPEEQLPHLQEIPVTDDIRPQPELPPDLLDISIDSFIRRQ